MNYPEPVDGKYGYEGFFKQYSGEHRVAEQNENGDETAYRWDKRHSRSQVHFWDVRNYNIALRDIFMFMVCKAEIPKGAPSWQLFVRIMEKKRLDREREKSIK